MTKTAGRCIHHKVKRVKIFRDLVRNRWYRGELVDNQLVRVERTLDTKGYARELAPRPSKWKGQGLSGNFVQKCLKGSRKERAYRRRTVQLEKMRLG